MVSSARLPDSRQRQREAGPVAVIGTTLADAGAEFGRAQFIRIGDDVHHSRHCHCIVGQTSRGRKGTSWGPVHRFFKRAEEVRLEESTLPFPSGSKLKVSHGPLSSGGGLVYAIRDPSDDVHDEDADQGVKDKRILVIEQELGAALRAFQRQGNNLSMILRTMWDFNRRATDQEQPNPRQRSASLYRWPHHAPRTQRDVAHHRNLEGKAIGSAGSWLAGRRWCHF